MLDWISILFVTGQIAMPTVPWWESTGFRAFTYALTALGTGIVWPILQRLFSLREQSVDIAGKKIGNEATIGGEWKRLYDEQTRKLDNAYLKIEHVEARNEELEKRVALLELEVFRLTPNTDAKGI
jgi:hypothetical protein